MARERTLEKSGKERFLSAQADAFAGAKGEEKVGLVRAQITWSVGGSGEDKQESSQGPFRPGRNLGAEEDAGLPDRNRQDPHKSGESPALHRQAKTVGTGSRATHIDIQRISSVLATLNTSQGPSTGSESRTRRVCDPLQACGRTEVRPYMGQIGQERGMPAPAGAGAAATRPIPYGAR